MTSDRPTLLLITGTGRSGTSTISGTMHHLGLSVPGPYLGANRSNPKGFFESKWAVYYHKRIHKRARVNDFDARLEALERVRAATNQEDLDALDAWLAEHDAQQLVVKDPRTVWHQRMWADRAAHAGRSIRYLSMLRHPAEVIGSRATYYANRAEEMGRRSYEISQVGRWIAASLVSERETRGAPRAFVRYADLLTDWRTVAADLATDLDLTYATGLDRSPGHPVDEFIEPDLRRIRVTWDDLDVPDALREIAQSTWDHLDILAGRHGASAEVSEGLDALASRYARLLEASHALAYDEVYAAAAEARAEGAKAARQKMKERARERKRARESSGTVS